MLLLFDIDGTLLSGAAGAHREAIFAALHAVHGIGEVQARMVKPWGRTDGEIARAILLDAGVSAERIDDRADAVRERCCAEYARRCPTDLSSTVLPGVRELLDAVSQREGVLPALLTGNYEPIAWLKLSRAGIGRHFARGQGAFGSDSDDRAALPAIARRRAGTRGHPYPRERTIVIGDTPRDIACARADSVRCAAVATGPYRVEQLADADWALAGAAGLRELLETVL